MKLRLAPDLQKRLGISQWHETDRYVLLRARIKNDRYLPQQESKTCFRAGGIRIGLFLSPVEESHSSTSLLH